MSILSREEERINFVISRDGLEGAKAFARQGIEVYTKSLSEPYGKAYAEELRGSIAYYQMFLMNQERVEL